MTRALALLACVASVMPLLAGDRQQRDGAVPRAVGTAVLEGTVLTTAEPPVPVRRALVTLSGAEVAGNRTAVTDDAGRFQFDGLPAGRYLLTAAKAAFVRTHYGSPVMGRGPGTPIALVDAQRVAVSVRLPRGAVLAGTVRDVAGRPIPSGQVRLSSPVTSNGEVRWVAVGTAFQITTDELGRYRVYGLTPGDYIVHGSGSSGHTGDVRLMTPAAIEAADRERSQRARAPASGAAPVPPEPLPQVSWVAAYAPGVPDRIAAQRFSLREGQEYLGADITLALGRSARVSGVTRGPNGQPLTNVSIAIVNTRDRSLWSSPGMVRPDANGAFTLPSMGPGEYAFVGTGTESSARSVAPLTLQTFAPFVVQGDPVTSVLLEFTPGGVVSGRVDTAGRALPEGARISLTQVDGFQGLSLGALTATPAADGTFQIDGVPAGQFRLRATGLGSLALRAAMLADRDTLDDPFEVTTGQQVTGLRVVLTDQPTVVTGTLIDQLGRPAPEYAVVMFSTDRALWFRAPRRSTGLVRLDSTGAFRITGLPPGSYYLSALTDASPQQLADPSFLEQLAARALTVTLSEGEQKKQDLKLSGS
jgi:protocatechuate 3,4-dioxygenase beta subunit